MSGYKKRIETLQVLVGGSPVRNRPEYRDILHELNEVAGVYRVTPDQRRRFLEAIHASRALESTLSAFLQYYRIRSKAALGSYLYELTKHTSTAIGQLDIADRNFYQNNIVKLRNAIAHQANKYPANDGQIRTLLSHLDQCLSRILNL
jgi:hypothetical protein